MITTQSHILEDLKRIGIEVILCGQIEVFFSHLRVQPTLIDMINVAHCEDLYFQKTFKPIKVGYFEFKLDENGILWFGQWLYVPAKGGLKKEILWEDHNSSLNVHPSSTKMYRNLKQNF